MKFIKYILFFLFVCPIVFSKSQYLVYSQDSLKYSDTVWSEIAPVCLNLTEVRKKVSYPPKAIKDSVQGRVVIKCLVDTEGNVEKTGEITGPEVFYNEIKKAALYLKFSPGRVNNYPVKVWVSVPFNFRLK